MSKINDLVLVQAFLKKWWVESDFKAPNILLSLRLKGSGCHYNSIYNNTILLFIGGGNRRKQVTCCKSLTNFITYWCIEYTSPELD
jgi:hypothetical protein